MLAVNAGLFPGAPEAFAQLLAILEFDRQAVLHGQVWRLLTGNLMHGSVEHLLLHVGVLLILDLLYARLLARHLSGVLRSCPERR